MTAFDVGLTAIGATVLVLGLLSGPIKQHFLSGPLLALLLGVLLGPEVLGLLTPAELGEETVLLERLSQLTVAVSLMAIALRLPRDYLRTHARSLAIVLGPVMIAMWLVSGLLAYAVLAVPLWVALLVGAVIAPTDPVISSTIVQGSEAERNLPARMRHFLSAEAGANDALSYPLVFLAVLMLTLPPSDALSEWLLRVMLWEVLFAVVFGGALGYAAGRALRWAHRSDRVARTSYIVFSLSLTVTVLGATELAKTNGLLGVFVAGLVFRNVISEQEDRDEEQVQEAANDFFLLPVFVLLGITLPWQEWAELGWRGPVLVVAVLLLRRLPAFLALGPFMRSVHGVREAAFLGWFGPVGAAALFYASLSVRETPTNLAWTVGSLVICASVLVHGVTATPLTRLFGRRAGKGAADRSGTPRPET